MKGANDIGLAENVDRSGLSEHHKLRVHRAGGWVLVADVKSIGDEIRAVETEDCGTTRCVRGEGDDCPTEGIDSRHTIVAICAID